MSNFFVSNQEFEIASQEIGLDLAGEGIVFPASRKIKFRSNRKNLLLYFADEFIAMIEDSHKDVSQSKACVATSYAECRWPVARQFGNIVKSRPRIVVATNGASDLSQPANLWLAALQHDLLGSWIKNIELV